MRVAIMQPYFLPYVGYFQLIGAVDRFVVYDDIKYTKKGWINRNRYLSGGHDAYFTVPLEKGSDYLDVRDRRVSADFDRDKLLNQLAAAYRKAPRFAETFPLLERVVRRADDNLFDFIHGSLRDVCAALRIETPLVVSSTLGVDRALRAQDKVLAICEALSADAYVNAIGGLELYDREAFAARGIALSFLKARPHPYPQLGGEFVPWLSILDVMMFNDVDVIAREMLNDFELV
jgi:hypothetical protein